jgi:hypothetical protein
MNEASLLAGQPSYSTAPPSTVEAGRSITRRGRVYLSPRGLRAASGISSSYDDKFPTELEAIGMRQKRFEDDILSINHALADYWPCPTCFIGGYVCVPCTLGLSLLCPNICVSGAESYVKHFIRDQVNYRLEYQERHVTWSLHRSCGGGYIMIEYDEILDV